jgi:hypothetical protein
MAKSRTFVPIMYTRWIKAAGVALLVSGLFACAAEAATRAP